MLLKEKTNALNALIWYIKHDPDPANLVYVLNAIVSSVPYCL